MGQKLRQPPWMILQIGVRPIQRLHDQVRWAGGAEQRQRRLDPAGIRFQAGTDVQVSRAGEGGQRLVGGIAAHISSEGNRVHTVLKKMKMRTVGIVHQKLCIVFPANRR